MGLWRPREVSFVDKTLQCRECGVSFVWTAGEQAFYASKGLMHQPVRCPDCRARKRQARSEGIGAEAGRRVQYTAVCADCGGEAVVPFIPRNDRPVYCSTCFEKHRPVVSAS